MTADDIRNIHLFLAEHYENTPDPIFPCGVKDEGLLQSACTRPYTTAAQKEMFEIPFDKNSCTLSLYYCKSLFS